MPSLDPTAFIRENLKLQPVPAVPEVVLYTAQVGSRLSRIAKEPPYWAYPWSGGAALARYFLDRPDAVRGRRVLDLGAGSGLVSIAAAKAGAAEVAAAEVDPNGLAALRLNADANDARITIVGDDLTGGAAPDVDLVAVGDLFYERELAQRVTVFLDRCLEAGLEVLVGDPGRADLPLPRLELIAEYQVPEVGAKRGTAATPSAVYRYVPTRG